MVLACGSFGGSDTPAGTPDSGDDTGGAADAAIGPDAGGDSTSAGPCPIIFVDSFETITSSWGQDLSQGGRLMLDTSEFGDASPSLRAVASLSDGGPEHAALVRTEQFADAGLGITQLSFAMKIEIPDGSLTYEEIGCQATLRNALNQGTVALFSRFHGGEIVAHVATDFVSGLAMQTPMLVEAPGVVGWFDANITIAPGSDGGAFTFTMTDRQTGKVYALTTNAPAPPNVDRVRIGCGVSYARLDMPPEGGASLVSAHVDDVVLRHCVP